MRVINKIMVGVFLLSLFGSFVRSARAETKATSSEAMSPATMASAKEVARMSPASSRYKHPSFVAGIVLLSIGVATVVPAAIVQSFHGQWKRMGTCVYDGAQLPCSYTYSAYPASPILFGVSAASLLSGAGSMLYWGLRVNVP